MSITYQQEVVDHAYAPLLKQFRMRLPFEVYQHIYRMAVSDDWKLHVHWTGNRGTLAIPLAGTQFDYDALCAYIALHAP